MATLRFFGQPKFKALDYGGLPFSYEFLIRERETPTDRWHLPADFNALTVDDLEPLLIKTLDTMPSNIKHVSFNLEVAQFVDTSYIDMVERVQTQTTIHLITELTERRDRAISDIAIKAAFLDYFDRNLGVILDDVGLDGNSFARVQPITDYVEGYKFALQNLRPFDDYERVRTYVKFWADNAARNNKFYTVEGIETQAELDNIRALYPYAYIQGYFLGKPELLPLPGDPEYQDASEKLSAQIAADSDDEAPRDVHMEWHSKAYEQALKNYRWSTGQDPDNKHPKK